jgi:NAD(P)-dependent dehydrogenase (short-subunit alcohol dehydrogenase family)
MTEEVLRGAVALVTGASRGIGAAITSELANAGAHVIAIARDQTKLAQIEQDVGRSCTGVACDLSSADAIKDLRREIEQRWGRLDVLVGNAAIMGRRTTLANLDDQDWADVLDTNVTANWRLIRSFDPLLRAAPHGRAVFMTSGAGSRARMGAARGAYAISKAALDALVRTYASETDGSDIRVMLCNPGPIRTSLRAQAAPDEDPSTLRTPAEVAPKVAAMCMPSWHESGRLYDFPTDRLLEFQEPA